MHDAVDLARELAGSAGIVLATGSIYLLAELLAAGRLRAGSDAVNDEGGPSVLAMIGWVALIVASCSWCSSRSAIGFGRIFF